MSNFFTVTALFSAVAVAFVSQVPLTPPFPDRLNEEWDDSCSISKSTAFEVYDGLITFSTSQSDHINSVKILPAVNSTNWEQWEFDGLSHTGLSGLLMAFSRDPSYAFFGQGNLRVEFYITLGDGTVIQELDYLKESYIIDCPDFTAGVWNSSDRSYSFHVTKDLKYAKLKFDSWRVRGGFTMSSSTPPHNADGSPWIPEGGNAKATELSPGMFYALPMGGAAVEVDATLGSGRRIVFSGRGGSTRLWATEGWLKICDGWKVIRAWAGPYSLVYWDLVSRMDWGVKYVSAHLFYDDQLVVGTNVGNVSETEDYVLATDRFDGELHGRYKDKNTGHIFEFVSPTQDRRWKFELEHMITQYEMGAGGGFGMTGFANRVTGGEVGEIQYEGRAQSEQTFWPEYIEEWKIWLVYGAGFLGKGKTQFMKLMGYIL
ncbi:uncharacterized protein LY89DRAFT_578802 [Mollisia scopiformis]|uniref:Uncharacterized protein n=1 Tax=Mollisia scopiformis TaxID=149040 RepID=A0A194XJY2_MOLSC|nr:uncharacterized protein LY89DRAFT_578802 [Mollisia scopiformis]KUJ20446.1 hypothetical protein LY89DRAFT_578802 [Mollisia scopiformis]